MDIAAELEVIERLLAAALPDCANWSGDAQRAVTAAIKQTLADLIGLRAGLWLGP